MEVASAILAKPIPSGLSATPRSGSSVCRGAGAGLVTLDVNL